MIGNYLTVGLRNALRRPGYTFINVVGLAVGVACCLLVMLYVNDELQFDRHHPASDRLYRLANVISQSSGDTHVAITPAVYGETLYEELPEVERYVRLHRANNVLVRRGENRFHEKNGFFFYTDAGFFDLFGFRLAKGDPATALVRPFSIVLTPQLARKYFGEADPIGATLLLDETNVFTVTGVLRDSSRPSHIPLDALLSISSLHEMGDQTGPGGMQVYGPEGAFFTSWHFAAGYTYLRLGRRASRQTVEAVLPGLIAGHLPAAFRDQYRPFLQPITEIHLHSDVSYDVAKTSDIAYIYVLSAIAVFILLIACANYVNLATARSIQRAREVGMRKVLGAHRRHLILQFIGESVILSLLATGAGLVLAWLCMPAFNSLAGKAFLPGDLLNANSLAVLVGIALTVGLGAGTYPAIFLARFRPTSVLAGHANGQPGAADLRQGLVIFQFTASLVLLIGTGIVYSQLHYLGSKDLGFEKEHVVVMDLPDQTANSRYRVLKETMQRHPNVLGVTASSAVPGHREAIRHDVQPEGASNDEQWLMALYAVDHDFLETLDLTLAAGRGFSPDLPSDSTEAYVLNEAAVATLGWHGEAVGRSFTWINPKKGPQKGRVIGVVKDFHFQPLRVAIEPAVFSVAPEWFNGMAIRIHPQRTEETLTFLTQTWNDLVPQYPFDYVFLDERFDVLYEAEQRFGKIISAFTLIALLVACLGLYGLTSFMVSRRMKEIAIRRVVGASATQIGLMLSRDLTRLVAIAFLLACPLGYAVMQRWLNGFAYHIEVLRFGWLFLAAGLVGLIIVLVTVNSQSLRAVLADPVDSLRRD